MEELRKVTRAEIDDAASALGDLSDDAAKEALDKDGYAPADVEKILARRSKLSLSPERAIDDSLWDAYLECEGRVLAFAIKYVRSKQRGQDLTEAAWGATLDRTRPWRMGVSLEAHLRGCIRSICSNENTSQSALVLKHAATQENDQGDEEPADPNPPADGRSPEEHASDNEETRALQHVGKDLLERSREGTLEHRFLLQIKDGVEDLHVIAGNLGITWAQAKDVRKSIKRKAAELLRKRGYVIDEDP